MTVMTPKNELPSTGDAIQPLLPGELATLVGDRANQAAAAALQTTAPGAPNTHCAGRMPT